MHSLNSVLLVSLHSYGNSVLAMLKENGVLVAEKQIVHRYPVDWRTKKPVIMRPMVQWFINLADLAKAAKVRQGLVGTLLELVHEVFSFLFLKVFFEFTSIQLCRSKN